MKVAAVVPFKRFTRAKRRLRTRYSDAAVEAIGRAMLEDVLEALGAARGLERVTVLTDDTAVAEVARAAGAEVEIRDPDPGLNPLLAEATEALLAEGFEAMLIVLGDLPLLQGTDVEAVLEAGKRHPVVLLPAADGGTALLYRRPPDRIPPRFGPESGAAHEAEARARGVEPFRLLPQRDVVRVDLDTPEDAERLLATGIPCRTREALRGSGG